jgi:transposase
MGISKLSLNERVQILSLLCEGASMRSVSRVTGVSINTVAKLLAEAGEACIDLHDEHVRGLNLVFHSQQRKERHRGRPAIRGRRLDMDRARRRYQANL